MTPLPSISGRRCVATLGKAGFTVVRQEGSHIVLRQTDPFAQVVVPDHREIDRGTWRSIIRDAGLSVDDFVGLLHGSAR